MQIYPQRVSIQQLLYSHFGESVLRMSKSNISADDFVLKPFDYIIVGGGTAGLVLAARLTENPSINVGIIEAGLDRSDDLLVRIPMLHIETYDKPEYDWMFRTAPQVSPLYSLTILELELTNSLGCKRTSPRLATW